MDEKKDKFVNTDESKRFVALFIPVQQKIYAYINYHTPNRNDSDDIFQEVAATLLSKFSDYQEGTDFLAWAITIARYKILSFIRDNKRTRILFDEADMDIIQHEALNRMEELDEKKDYLKKCLKKLPYRKSKLLQYRYKEEMTYRQIAKQFNISMQSVYKSIARIHIILLKCINMHSRLGGINE